MANTTLAIFPRTTRTEVRLSLSEFRGQPLVDLRLYFLSKEGEWLPTRKGCAIQPGELADLLGSLERAQLEVAP